MRVALVLSVVFFASAAEDQVPASLKGSSSPFGVVDLAADEENMATTTTRRTANTADVAMSEDAFLEGKSGEGVSGSGAASTNASELVAVDIDTLMAMASKLSNSNVALVLKRGGWHEGGDKIWGSGTGVENITFWNAGYYNAGMYAARARCGGADCALIVNPPGHRSVEQFHIHFVHYGGYGADLKSKLESRVCWVLGWRAGDLPCGGRAAFFPGFPAVFTAAMLGGGLRHASVIAWPKSCGGRGTIVQLAYDCSIEHQLRGDYDPSYR